MMRERTVVLWFNKKKGFGFLQGVDGPDVFVHYSGIIGEPGQRNLQSDQVVEFTRVIQNGKAKAFDVVVIDAPLVSVRKKGNRETWDTPNVGA